MTAEQDVYPWNLYGTCFAVIICPHTRPDLIIKVGCIGSMKNMEIRIIFGKCIRRQKRCVSGKTDTLQTGTMRERTIMNQFHRSRKINLFQEFALPDHVCGELGNAIQNDQTNDLIHHPLIDTKERGSGGITGDLTAGKFLHFSCPIDQQRSVVLVEGVENILSRLPGHTRPWRCKMPYRYGKDREKDRQSNQNFSEFSHKAFLQFLHRGTLPPGMMIYFGIEKRQPFGAFT